MKIESDRLILRPWEVRDAAALFKYAKDAEVALPAGWEPHPSVEFSLQIIKTVFSAPETFAIVLKETGEPVGCCGIVPAGARLNVMTKGRDVELGYWLGKPYWGKNIVPEAVNALIECCFNKLVMERAWISFYNFNVKSRRVAEKCGFKYHHTDMSGDVTEVFFMKENLKD